MNEEGVVVKESVVIISLVEIKFLCEILVCIGMLDLVIEDIYLLLFIL